jgi:hypothetical protein
LKKDLDDKFVSILIKIKNDKRIESKEIEEIDFLIKSSYEEIK